jgi:hypothetical protein
MIREVHVKDHLTSLLFDAGSQNIVHEVGVVRGGVSRIDVLDFTTEVHGYEIKTAVDSVSRLPLQVKWYGKVMNKITLVAATKHLKKALTIIPDYWGLKEIVEVDGNFAIIDLRPALSNPDLDKHYYVSMLWAPELKEIMRKRGMLKALASKAHWNMANRMALLMQIEDLTPIIIETFKNRNNLIGNNDSWKQQKRLML